MRLWFFNFDETISTKGTDRSVPDTLYAKDCSHLTVMIG